MSIIFYLGAPNQRKNESASRQDLQNPPIHWQQIPVDSIWSKKCVSKNVAAFPVAVA